MTGNETNVLVVEDDARVVQCQRLLLEGDGFKVAWAASGEQAIEMVADHTPDLVLLDIGLPGIDGFTTCKVIRKFSQVPIIMVTGNGQGEDKVRGLDLGADDYITKPFSESELVARFRAVLRRSTAGEERPTPVEALPSPARSQAGFPALSSWLGDPARRLRRSWSSMFDGGGSDTGAAGFAGRLTRPALPLGIRQWIVKAGGRLSSAFNALGGLARTAASRAWNCPWLKRLRSSGPPRKLAQAAADLWGSAPVKNAVADCSRLKRWGLGRFRRLPGAAPRPRASRAQDSADRGNSAITRTAVTGDAAPGDFSPANSPELEFLEELLRAYLKVAETVCPDPLVSVPVVPLVSVYEQMVSWAAVDEGHSSERFARDVHRLHCSGIDTTRTGARVQFPISRGVSGKTLVLTDQAGQEVRYYGIRFMPARHPDRDNPPPGRAFDAAQGDRYGVELQGVLARQLEWPSDEFVRFLAGEINLGDLDHKEGRQLAQIARDSLQRLFRKPPPTATVRHYSLDQ